MLLPLGTRFSSMARAEPTACTPALTSHVHSNTLKKKAFWERPSYYNSRRAENFPAMILHCQTQPSHTASTRLPLAAFLPQMTPTDPHRGNMRSHLTSPASAQHKAIMFALGLLQSRDCKTKRCRARAQTPKGIIRAQDSFMGSFGFLQVL